MNEFELIARYFTASRYSDDVKLGVGDDAAVVCVPTGFQLVAAVDTIVEGGHFPVGSAAEDIAYRALAVNLSDIAAMGAIPKWFTLSLCVPTVTETWLGGFAQSLNELAARFDVQLIGGDTVKGPLNISIQILGIVEQDRWLRRSGAKPGDLIFVSGVPGEAAGGLNTLLHNDSRATLDGDNKHVSHLVQRFLKPEPRIALGRALRPFASAAMDISDGLLGDLGKLCRASGCGASLQLEKLPHSPSLVAMYGPQRAEQLSLSGGDDYELLFTIAPHHLAEVERVSSQCGVSCTHIGSIDNSGGVACSRGNQPVTINQVGYDHFALNDMSVMIDI